MRPIIKFHQRLSDEPPAQTPKFLTMEILDNDTDLQNQDYAPAAQQSDESASCSTEPQSTVEEEIARLHEDDTAEEMPASKEVLIEKMSATLEKEEEFSTDLLNRFKQQYYLLHNLELRRELDAYVAAGNDADSFTPSVDTTEEQFRSLLTALKEKKAQMRMRLEARQQANLEQKRAIIAELNTMSSDTDNVNRH